jgi:hypothetical protein
MTEDTVQVGYTATLTRGSVTAEHRLRAILMLASRIPSNAINVSWLDLPETSNPWGIDPAVLGVKFRLAWHPPLRQA